MSRVRRNHYSVLDTANTGIVKHYGTHYIRHVGLFGDIIEKAVKTPKGVTLTFAGEFKNAVVTVFDIKGRRLLRRDFRNCRTAPLDIRELSGGMLFLHVRDGDVSETVKVNLSE